MQHILYVGFLKGIEMVIKIEREKNCVIIQLPAEATTPDSLLRANVMELIEAKNIKALLTDMLNIFEITEELLALMIAIQSAAGRNNLRVIYFNVNKEAKDFLKSSDLANILEIYDSKLQAMRMLL